MENFDLGEHRKFLPISKTLEFEKHNDTKFETLFFNKNCICTNFFKTQNHVYWGHFLRYIDLPYHFGNLRMSTFCWSQWFSTKLNRIFVVHRNASKLFFRTDLTYVIVLYVFVFFKMSNCNLDFQNSFTSCQYMYY